MDCKPPKCKDKNVSSRIENVHVLYGKQDEVEVQNLDLEEENSAWSGDDKI